MMPPPFAGPPVVVRDLFDNPTGGRVPINKTKERRPIRASSELNLTRSDEPLCSLFFMPSELRNSAAVVRQTKDFVQPNSPGPLDA